MVDEPSQRAYQPVQTTIADTECTPCQITFPTADADETQMTPRTHAKWKIRHTPVEDSKYLPLWKKIKTKLKIQRFLGALNREIQLCGNTTTDNPEQNYKETDVVVSESIPFCMFHPNRKPKLIWNMIVIFLLVYTATVMPFRIAFIENKLFDEWFFIDLFIDVLFFIDVLVNLTSAYYDNEGQLVVSRYKILINYLTSWMVIDILACIPFNLINMQEEENANSENSN